MLHQNNLPPSIRLPSASNPPRFVAIEAARMPVGADKSAPIRINLTKHSGSRVGAGVGWMWGEGPCGRPLGLINPPLARGIHKRAATRAPTPPNPTPAPTRSQADLLFSRLLG